LFARVREHLDAGAPVRTLSLDADEQTALQPLHLITAKPVLFAANVQEDGFADNPLLQQVQAHAAKQNALVVPVSAALEGELAQLDGGEKQAFLEDLGLSEPGFDRINQAGDKVLGMETSFTVGPKEGRAWTVKAVATVLKAEDVTHTDDKSGFIPTEGIAYGAYIV